MYHNSDYEYFSRSVREKRSELSNEDWKSTENSQPLDFSRRRSNSGELHSPSHKPLSTKARSLEAGIFSSCFPTDRSSPMQQEATHQPQPYFPWLGTAGTNEIKGPDFASRSMEDLNNRNNLAADSGENHKIPTSVPLSIASLLSPNYIRDIQCTAAAALAMNNKTGFSDLPPHLANAALLAQLNLQNSGIPQPPALQNLPMFPLPQELRLIDQSQKKISCVQNLQEKFHIAPSEIPAVHQFPESVLTSFASIRAASDASYKKFREEVLRKKKEDNSSKSRRSAARSTPYSIDGKCDLKPSDDAMDTTNGDSQGEGAENETTDVRRRQYMEKRRKNNEAAKKSRDQRKCKEEETAIRAAFLEIENKYLAEIYTTLRNVLFYTLRISV